MDNKFIEKVRNTFNKAMFSVKKHSPEIFVAVGIVGVVTSAVVACRATLKVNDILSDSEEKLDKINECADDESHEYAYSEKDAAKDKAIVYIQTGVKLAKLYAPAIAIGMLSLSCILASNDILRKRNAALTAAYVTIDNCFKEYRSNVIERFGKELDHQLRYGIKTVQVDETVKDENGNEKTVTKSIEVMENNPYDYSNYAKVFDETNQNYEKCSEYNLMFLNNVQKWANERLKKRGTLFLNEVYDKLGFEPTKAGQVVGWVYDPSNEDIDSYVDFGIFDVNRPKARDFVNGYERAVVLDFNCDGNVWELMK